MFDQRRISELLILSASVLVGFVMAPGSVFGQEGVIEEIQVRGIRKSQSEALGIKKENTNFVDAISAEDVGKLPDRNIAEALQRVPGIAIQRERGEGDFVSIRGLGPDFVKGTINGRSYTSGTESFDSTLNGASAKTTGRATNFDVLPSEIIDTLEVYKSASAEQVEGGIGGVVNIKTARPMTLGNAYGGTIRGQYGDFSKDTDPSGAAYFSWSNDDNFGILGSVSYSERNIREDLANSFGYANSTVFGGVFNSVVDSDGDGLGDVDPDATFAPFSANPEIFIEERERFTLNSTLQWLLSEDTEVLADVLWTKREVSTDQFGAIYSLLPNSQAGVGFCNTAPNADGSYTCPSAVIENDTLVSFPVTSNIEDFTDVRESDDESLNLGFSIEHHIGAWNLSGDVSYADATGGLGWGRSVMSLANGVAPPAAEGGNPTTIIRTITGTGSTRGGVGFTPDAADPEIANPANYVIQQNELRDRDNSDEELALRFDIAYEQDGAAISAIKAGAHWRSREKSFTEFMGNNGGRNNPVLATSISDSTMTVPGSFLDGGLGGLTPSDMLFPNHAAVLGARGQNITLVENTLASFVAEEDTIAAYLQVDFNGGVAAMEFSGNAGVRYVRTETDVVGQSQNLTLEQQGTIRLPVLSGPVEDFPFAESYDNVLPSLNFRLDITDELLARFSYSKTLTRPEFTLLAPSLGIVNATQRIASFGNPGLEPYLADNLDFSLEWYFSEASAVTAAVFYKEVDDFIVSSTNLNVNIAGVDFNSVSQPDNQGEAEILGFEAGYTHALSFLPAPFDGLGLIFNLTAVDSELKLNSGREVPFLGVSDLSINSAIYYDKGPVQMRLAYSWRDEFLFDPDDVFVNSELSYDDYGQMDFSASYEINNNFTAFVDVINLTDEQEKQYANSALSEAGSTRPLSIGQVGRRIGFGLRASF